VQIPFLPPKTVHLNHLSWLLRLANTSASGFIAMALAAKDQAAKAKYLHEDL
jgi:hypothetical protein